MLALLMQILVAPDPSAYLMPEHEAGFEGDRYYNQIVGPATGLSAKRSR